MVHLTLNEEQLTQMREILKQTVLNHKMTVRFLGRYLNEDNNVFKYLATQEYLLKKINKALENEKHS